MKKKVLLGLLALSMCVSMVGCGKTESAKKVTYSDLKISTDEAYKDIESASIEMDLSASVTHAEETLNVKADVVASFDVDTIYMKLTADLGMLESMVDSPNYEIYIDYADKENALIYAKTDDTDEWFVTTGNYEDLIAEIGMDFDSEDFDLSKIDMFEDNITVTSKDDTYVITSEFTGTELFDIIKDFAEEEVSDYEEMIADYLDAITFEITGTYNSDKVLEDICIKIVADNLDVGAEDTVDATVDFDIQMTDLNSKNVEVPTDIVENAIEFDDDIIYDDYDDYDDVIIYDEDMIFVE